MYEEGRGVIQSNFMAKALFQEASDRGHIEAQQKVPPTPFPPPPVPGNAHIQPLSNQDMLQEEGKAMHHCVDSYSYSVRLGSCYIYKVLKPARATVEIVPAGSGTWEISEIKSYCNAEPAPGVIEIVDEWLEQHNRQALATFSPSRHTPPKDK